MKRALVLLPLALFGCDFLSHSQERSSSGSPGAQPTAEQPMRSPFSPSKEKAPPTTQGYFEAPQYSVSVAQGALCPATGPFRAQAGMKKVSFLVKVENLHTSEFYLTPLAMAIDGGDHLYRATLAGCKPGLEARELPSGAAAEGAVAFEVPEELAPPWDFVFQPLIVGQPPEMARLRVKLEGAASGD